MSQFFDTLGSVFGGATDAVTQGAKDLIGAKVSAEVERTRLRKPEAASAAPAVPVPSGTVRREPPSSDEPQRAGVMDLVRENATTILMVSVAVLIVGLGLKKLA